MIVVEGSTMTVSRVIPGVFDKIEITSDLVARASRVADDCDAEIIRLHLPQ
jgi:pyruvate-ferredoxin/flavodoxin oxidoreductase